MAYMEDHSKVEGCIFCAAQAQPDGPENLIAYRGKQSFVIMNLYPYTSGHLMVVPYAHKATLEDLDPVTRGEMMDLAVRCMAVLREIYHPHGFNMGANIGEAAGAGILDHVHIHIVPRWVGDTNFMSSLAGTRVLPEIVQDTYERVRAAFQ